MAKQLIIEPSIEIKDDAVAARVHYRMMDDVTHEFFGTANVHLVLPPDTSLTVQELHDKVMQRSKEILAELVVLVQ